MGNCIIAAPSEAQIISGPRGTRVIVGKTSFQLCCCERVDPLSLELLTIELNSKDAETTKGVPLTVTSVAQVRVNAVNSPEQFEKTKERLNYDGILLAAQHFLDSTEQDIISSLQRTLEGHQRQILGTLTVEEIYKDRAAFSARVQEHVMEDLQQMGFMLVSYTVEKISDSSGYMQALGQTQTSLVKREAAEGTARNESEAKRKVAQFQADSEKATAEVLRESHVLVNKQKELEAESDSLLEMKRAEYKRLQNIKYAEADIATKIEVAKQNQAVIREQTQQKLIEAEIELNIASAVIERSQKEKEGEAKAKLLAQKNDAEALLVMARAEADKIRLIGDAKADAIRADGKAQADTLRERASAFKEYGDAALVEMIVQRMPEIAHELSAPLAKTDKIVFVSSDGQAASRMTGDMVSMLAQVPHAVKSITGFDITEAISRSTGTGPSTPTPAASNTGRRNNDSSLALV